MNKVIIGCRLPHGLILSLTTPNGTIDVEIEGINLIEKIRRGEWNFDSLEGNTIGDGYVTSEIDSDFWDKWKKINKTFKPLTSGAIFEAKSLNDAKAIAREFYERETGFEPMEQVDDVKKSKRAQKD